MINHTATMSRDEAIESTRLIREASAVIDRELLRIHDLRGYEAMGYNSFSDYCSAELTFTRSWAHMLIRTAPVVETVEQAIGVTPGRKHANELARLPYELQAVAYKRALTDYGNSPTVGQVRGIVNVFTSIANGAGVEAKPGEMYALDAAIQLEETERRERQKQHIRDSYAGGLPRRLHFRTTDKGTILLFDLPPNADLLVTVETMGDSD